MSVRTFPQRRSSQGFGSTRPGPALFARRTATVSPAPTPTPTPTPSPGAGRDHSQDISRLESRIAELELSLSALKDGMSQSGGGEIDLPGSDFDPWFLLTLPRRPIGPFGRPNYPPATRVTKTQGVVSGLSPFTISGASPEIRFAEVDQTDPAGRYGWGSAGDVFYVERKDLAAWADVLGAGYVFLEYNVGSKFVAVSAPQGDDWYSKVSAGVTTGKIAAIQLTASATPTVVLQTGDNAGSLITRMTFRGGAATSDIDIGTARLDLNGAGMVGLGLVAGEGTGDVNIKAYKATTDATARRIALLVLDPATDTEYIVANAVPKAATPLFTFVGSDFVPTTAELDAGHYYVGFTKATDTATLYMNEGGVIKTLVLGVAV